MWKKFVAKAKPLLSLYFEKGHLQKFAVALGFCLLAAQMSHFFHQAHLVNAQKSVVSAVDNDGASAILTAMNTQLFNDNGWPAYGPTYYRVVRLLHMMNPHLQLEEGLTADEKREKEHHLYLILISLLSLFALSLLLSCILFKEWPLRLLSTSLLLGGFLMSREFTALFIHAHPDHLFALSIAIAVWMTWRSYLQPQNYRLLIFAASCWGVAASIKLTVLLFAPAMIVFFIGTPLKEIPQKALRLIGITFFAYFLIGFPQTPRVDGPIKFLIQIRSAMAPLDWPAFVDWMQLFANQLQVLWPLLLLIILLPIRKLNLNISLKQYLVFFVLFLLPSLNLISRKVMINHYWYPIPFVVSIVTLFCIGAVLASNLLQQKFPALENLSEKRRNIWYIIAAFFVLPRFADTVPANTLQFVNEINGCQSEIKKVLSLVDGHSAQGGRILADPYIPYSEIYNEKNIFVFWEFSPSLISEKQADMIALKSNYYRSYLPASENGFEKFIGHVANMENVRNFYRLFHGKTETLDPQNKKWYRVYSDRCSFEIWKQTPEPLAGL